MKDTDDTGVELVWPDPPQEARIRYLYSLHEPGDIGIRPGMFSRFVQIFVGRERQGMLRPYAVAADDELICVVDPGLKVVHLYMTKQSRYEVIRDADGEDLMSPVGISLGPDAIYVADSAAGKVFVFDREGKHLQTISDLTRPTGIAFHPQNQRLYVTDTIENRIAVFDGNGTQHYAFGTRGRAMGEFNFPTTLAVRGDSLFVNDTMNYRIQRFTLDGSPVASFGEIGDSSGQFALSKGLGIDDQGHLYVADALSNYIQIFDEDGRFLLSFGGMGGAVGHFRLPGGVFVYGNKIFVADTENRRIQVFEYVGGET
ncbi:MAG: SMP-30/gluconolactonase/LRE family protein [Gammaproteobacteria bacterium]|nr:SMP-30/gluconolactonase/LRE family protein [Gammaproteobacteria bacterium]